MASLRPDAAAPRRPRAPSDPPEAFSLEERTLLLAQLENEGGVHSLEDIARAERVVFDWARANGKRKRDWMATVRNAIREGWALRGRTPKGGSVDEDWIRRMEEKHG